MAHARRVDAVARVAAVGVVVRAVAPAVAVVPADRVARALAVAVAPVVKVVVRAAAVMAVAVAPIVVVSRIANRAISLRT